MEILPFAYKSHFDDCMSIFDSNCPEFFLESERAEFAQWLSDKEEPYWVLFKDNTAIGCGGIYFSVNHTKSTAVFDDEVGFAWGMVHADYHKKGFGKVLFNFRIKYLKEHYPKRPIVLRTSQLTNVFFEKLGFKTTEYIKDGWGSGLDKVIMVYQA